MPAGGFLDLSQFNFQGELLTSLAELAYEDLIKAPDVGDLVTIFPGIVAKKEMGLIGKGGLVGKAAKGCDDDPGDYTIPIRRTQWDPALWEVALALCYADLEGTAAVYSLNTGVRIPDLTDTDYMAIVRNVLVEALREMFFRFVWFGDTDAATAGILSPGVDPEFFDVIDGFWKQVMAAAVDNNLRKATIVENAGATYAAQELIPSNVIGYLNSVYYKAPLQLRSMADREILVTQSVYDAYQQALSDSGCCTESARAMLQDGSPAPLYINGTKLVPVPKWDEMIAEYENDGTKLNQPHRILFTSKSLLGVAVDATSSIAGVETFYDVVSKKVFIRAMGRIDAELLNPSLLSLGI